MKGAMGRLQPIGDASHMPRMKLIAAGAILMLAAPALAAPKGAAALDANADGKVTLAEFQAGRGGQMMTKLDADKDGKLSRAEFSAMRKPKADAPAPAAAKTGKGADRMWSRVDADNDGALTMAELKTGAGKAKVGI